MKQSKKGFTLVEMMLVIAIIVILAGTALISIGDSLRKSQESQDKYKEHVLLVDSARDDIHSMMHVNPPTYVPVSPSNTDNTNTGAGGGVGGGDTLPVGGGGGNAPLFEETNSEEQEEVTEPETDDSDVSEPEVTEPEVSESESGSGSESGSSTGSSTSTTSDAQEGPFTVKGGYVTEDGANGVRSVTPTSDGSYEIVIGTRYYKTDFKISVSGNTITFISDKYFMNNEAYNFSFKGDLWKGDTFTLTASDKAEFEKQFGLVF